MSGSAVMALAHVLPRRGFHAAAVCVALSNLAFAVAVLYRLPVGVELTLRGLGLALALFPLGLMLRARLASRLDTLRAQSPG